MAEFEVWPPTEWSESSEGSNQGQREEIEGLIGESYAALRRREWTEFEKRRTALARYSWPEVGFIINQKMMRASHPAAMNLAFIYDEVTAAPFSSPPHSGHHSHSPVYPEMTWEWVGGFYNGEAHLDATVREHKYYGYKYRFLNVKVEIGQKDRSVLEKINAFLEKNLGAIGKITYDPSRKINILHHTRAEDCFLMAKKLLPYLHLPLRRKQAQKLTKTTLDYARKQAPKERKRHRIKFAERWERILELGKNPPSRWVLEMYAPNMREWHNTLTQLTRKPLTTREHELVSSFDRFMRRKGFLTARQVEVLKSIARRHRVELPAIPA